MRSISNNLLASEQLTVKQMTDNSLQELDRLQAVAAALQERPDDELDTTELEDAYEDYDADEDLLAQMGDDSFDEGSLTDETEDGQDYFDEEQDGFDEEQDGFEEDDELIDETQLEDDDYFDDEEDNTSLGQTQVTETSDVSADDEIDESDMLNDGFDDSDTVEAEADATEYDVDLSDYEDDTEEDFEDGFEDGFEDDEDDDYIDGFEDDVDDGFEDSEASEVVTPSVTSTPLAPPVATRPIVSAPLLPPGLRPPVSQTPVSNVSEDDDEQELLGQLDLDDDFDEQEEENDYADDDTDLDAQILEEMEDDEQYDLNDEDGAPNFANSFENFEPETETTTKTKISDDVQFDSNFGNTDIDLSLLDSVPMIDDTPTDSKTVALEEENARLRQQLAELENEKLKQQIAAQQKASLTVSKAGGTAIQNKPTVKENTQPNELDGLTQKEKEQRIRWKKYATMSTHELWKYVYKFMTMAGVTKAPVKAKILIEEFGSHNIKRLEATYIMATKDGYTC